MRTHGSDGSDATATGGRPMYPSELLVDPAADRTLDDAATALIDGTADRTAERLAAERARMAGARSRAGRLLDDLLAEFPEPADLLALRGRYGSWGEVNIPIQVSVPVVAAGYIRAAGLSAADVLTAGLALIVSGVPPELVDMLAAPTADGAAKRAAGLKPHWKTQDALDVHAEAMWRHFESWNTHGRWGGDDRLSFPADAESGAHPLAHAAWRALAVAYLESEAVRG